MSEPSIKLHKSKGLNQRMTVCMDCGKDVGVVLLGAAGYLFKCTACGKTTYGVYKHTTRCPQCKTLGGPPEEIPDDFVMPSEVCDGCKVKRKEFHDMATEAAETGGIIAVCRKCHARMVVSGESELAKEVRKKAPAPKVVATEVPDCPNCRPKEKTDD